MPDLHHARSFLFVPGHRPDRFAKAAGAGADAVVLDLEDAVAAGRKAEARASVRAWLRNGNRALVRINPPGTPWYEEDLGAVGDLAAAIVVPKSGDPAALHAMIRRLPRETGLIPLLETASGIMNALAVCAVPAVVRPAFGSVDLAADLRVDHLSHTALRHARSALVLAAAAAGCAAPIDGVTSALEGGDTPLLTDLREAAELGFTGKLCIHPRQVAAVNQCLTPAEDEIEWARAVLAADVDGSVTAFRGQMIDRPVVLRAQSILARI